MRQLLRATALAIPLLLSCAACATAPAHEAPYAADNSDARAQAGIFYDALRPYGEWLFDGTYGWVWCPSDLAPDWRPYTDGFWIYTDAGWCWQADEPWGWAPYHYGRWDYQPQRGWVWLPGSTWAPAWVAWRYTDGWVGWAPLPPAVAWRADSGIVASGVELDLYIEPFWWSFCGDAQFTDRDLRRRIEPLERNATLLTRTRNVTRLVTEDRMVVDRAIEVDRIEAATHHTIRPRRMVDLQQPPTRSTSPRGDAVAVFRPLVRVGSPEVAMRGSIVDPRASERSGGGGGRMAPRTLAASPPPAGAPHAPAGMERSTPQPHPLPEDRQPEANIRKRWEALEKRQRLELQHRSPDVTTDELHARHEAERRLLNEQDARERQLQAARRKGQR